MEEYVFLRINSNFRNLFINNLKAFLELYHRRNESVFYKEQFRLFLEKNKQKEIINYLKNKLDNRDELVIDTNKLFLNNKYSDTREIMELSDNYLTVKSNFKKSAFSRYLLEYDSDFLVIDAKNDKIQRLILVN